MTTALSPDTIRKALATVIDPELTIPITEMGLIYDIVIADNGAVTVVMTLTTVGCPLFETIHDDITRALSAIPGVTDVTIDLTFDPPWTPEMMSERVKADIGLL